MHGVCGTHTAGASELCAKSHHDELSESTLARHAKTTLTHAQNECGSHRGECFWEIRFRGSPIRFAAKLTIHLLWDVTGSFACAVIFIETSYVPETLGAMRSEAEMQALPGQATQVPSK